MSDRSRHDDLLSRSGADAIFSSSHWLGAWWNVFGDLNAARPRTAAAFVGDSLVAFLPVAIRERRLRGALRITSLQPLGAGWRESDVALSEYLGPVVDAQAGVGAVDALLRFILQEVRTDEVVFPHADLTKPWLAVLERVAAEHGFHFRIADRVSAYRVDLTYGFAHYIALLSANSRRKLIAQRRKLEALGDVSLHTYAADELDAGIEALTPQLTPPALGSPGGGAAPLRSTAFGLWPQTPVTAFDQPPGFAASQRSVRKPAASARRAISRIGS